MRSRFLFALFACLLATALFTVGCGGGGGDDSISSPTSATNPGSNEGNTSGSGVATGLASSNAVSQSVRMNIRAAVTAPATGAQVIAGDYNEAGEFVDFGVATTTDDNGYYRLERLPTGRKNIVIRVTTRLGEIMEGILPLIDENVIASAPVIDPKTKYQAKLVKFAEKFDATFEINLGEILSIIPPGQLPTTDTDLEKIAQAFVNREKAQLQTFRAAGLADDKFLQFRKYAFDLQNQINAGIAEGLYGPTEGWQLFNDQLRLMARTLGLPSDVMLALQDIDTSMVATALPPSVSNLPQIQQQIEYQHILAKLEGLRTALKVLTPTYLPQADYELIAAGVERISTALKTAPDATSVETILRTDTLHGLFQAAFKTIFTNLDLLSGAPPMIARLYPSPTEVQAVQTAAGGFIPDLEDMTVAYALRGQTTPTVTNPTPTQITSFHDAIKDLMVGKIMANLNLTEAQATALFVLLMQGPELGFSYVPSEIPQTGIIEELPSEIMGVIVASGSSLYIQPPTGFPEAPAEFGGFIAKVATESLINGQVVTATSTPHIYSGSYTQKPALNTPPTFKITGIINGTVTIPELNRMTFTGGPLEQDANGKFWFGLGKPVATEFVPTSDMVANTMQGFLGRMVEIEGMITEKRPAPDYGPAVVEVYAIMPASMTGYIPPDVDLPTVPVYGTLLEDQSGLWSFNKEATEPRNMFKFTWTVGNTATSAYVDFNPDGLDKVPQFRYQNQASGRDLWESDGHTVTISGKAFTAPDGALRIFMTTFLDESTVWPDATTIYTPPAPPTTGIPMTNQVGTWTVDPNPTDGTKAFKFTWLVNNVATSAYVAFDPATLDKTPDFRFQDPTNGHDMWESNDHQVLLTGSLSPDGMHLFITKFVDQSTIWPPVDTMPKNTVMRIRGILLPYNGPTTFAIGHYEVFTGTNWVPATFSENVSPDVILEPGAPAQLGLVQIFGDGSQSPYGVDLTGTWAAPTLLPGDPTVTQLHFIPATARAITAAYNPPGGWTFGN